MRDIRKQAEKGRTILKNHKRADLTLSEINEFYKVIKENGPYPRGLFDVINMAFEMGVAVGARNAD